MSRDASNKTEPPTEKRLRRAIDEGDAGVSSFAAQSAAFLAAALVIPAAIASTFAMAIATLRNAISHAANRSSDFTVASAAILPAVLRGALPIIVVAAIVSLIVHAMQTRATVRLARVAPRLDRLNLVAGFRRLFSKQRFFAVARALIAAAAIAIAAWRLLTRHAADIAALTGSSSRNLAFAASLAESLLAVAIGVAILLGAVDLVVTRFSWKKRLMMTKEEVKREHRESEGDPQIKAARERAHIELLNSATISNVRNATVVVINPTHLACALRYNEDDGDDTPVVVASGNGELAQRIVRAAYEYGVPVVQNVPLARALIELEIGDAIPEPLYEAIAEILHEIGGEDERHITASDVA